LCLAVQLAAREGLPPPVPATLHFGNVGGTGEDEWQELVIRHLGLTDWIRLSFTDELEALGPVATALLERFSVLSPPNLYLHVPLFEAARGGALLTGVGGDEIFDSEPSRLGLLLSRRTTPRLRDLRRVALVVAPRPLRERALRHRRRVTHPWLRPAAQDWLARLVAREEAAMPERWEQALRTWWASRYVQGSTRGFVAVAAEHTVAAAHPFLAPQFLSALSVAGGPGGFMDRGEVLQRLFADVLPPELERRRDKAVFDAAVWGTRVKTFADEWDGTGIDGDLVDIDALQRSWLAGERDYRTLLLLQTAWLAGQRLGRSDGG
jgi:asparagine synthase (glutamine-hydrolysing)